MTGLELGFHGLSVTARATRQIAVGIASVEPFHAMAPSNDPAPISKASALSRSAKAIVPGTPVR